MEKGGTVDLAGSQLVAARRDFNTTWLRFALRELGHFLGRPASARAKVAGPEGTHPVVFVGNTAASLVGAAPAPAGHVSARRARGRTTVTITGEGRALKQAILEFLSRLDVARPGAPRTRAGEYPVRPLTEIRGLYAHQHWAYAYPYSLRTWKLRDWKAYIDFLAHLGLNRLQIWPMVDIMPHPFSKGDARYLAMLDSVAKYARDQRGMEVSIGTCGNTVGKPGADRVPISQRDYFPSEERLDIRKRPALERLLAARADFYRRVPSARAHWIIDSDPGGYQNSTEADFRRLLTRSRDRLNAIDPDRILEYWMWFGWERCCAALYGWTRRREPREPDFAAYMQALAEARGPWRFLVCRDDTVETAVQQEVAERSIYYPYGALEMEPSTPFTLNKLRTIDYIERRARATTGLLGFQGNAQTPLVQLPNIYCFAMAALGRRPRGDHAALLKLGVRLCPELGADLASGWRLLHSEKLCDAPKLKAVAARLERKAAREPAPGVLGSVCPMEPADIATDLALMLRVRAAELAAIRKLTAKSLTDFLAASLAWYGRHRYRWYVYQTSRIYLTHSHESPIRSRRERLASPWARLLTRDRNEADRLLAQARKALLARDLPEKEVDLILAEWEVLHEPERRRVHKHQA